MSRHHTSTYNLTWLMQSLSVRCYYTVLQWGKPGVWEQGVPAWTALVRAFGIGPEAAKQAQCLSRWLSGEALFHIIMTQALHCFNVLGILGSRKTSIFPLSCQKYIETSIPNRPFCTNWWEGNVRPTYDRHTNDAKTEAFLWLPEQLRLNGEQEKENPQKRSPPLPHALKKS